MNQTRKPLAALGLVTAAMLVMGASPPADLPEAEAVGEMMTIHVLADDGSVAESIEVMFNPTEYTIQKSVPWNKHKSSKGDQPLLEFTSADPAVLSVELLFDSFAQGDDVAALVASIQGLATVHADTRRPPALRIEWGAGLRFPCVMQSVEATYTLFSPDAVPMRANVELECVEYTLD